MTGKMDSQLQQIMTDEVMGGVLQHIMREKGKVILI